MRHQYKIVSGEHEWLVVIEEDIIVSSHKHHCDAIDAVLHYQGEDIEAERQANRIDGYDRDDLGESADY